MAATDESLRSGKACDTGGVAPRYACDGSCEMAIDTELEPAELEGRVLEAIELIRPALQSDGGDIVFDNLDGDGVVHVTLVGACGTCPISMQTLKAGVERIIMDRAPGVTAVVDDSLADEDPFA
jgi:Fe-S cluster biogenesis protein NfuA